MPLRGGGAAELFEDRVSAIGYTPGDAAELAARLAELVEDATRRDAIVRPPRGRRRCGGSRPSAWRGEFREVYAG